MNYITKFFKNNFKISSPYKVDNTPIYHVKEEPGVLGRANNDGTIEIKSGLPKAKEKKVIAHEKQHMRDMKAGKLNYDDNFVYWNSGKYKRTNDNKIVYNGKKFPEGHSKLPWEAVANKAERKVS